jgi:class 3 adenylate cyclase
MDQVRPDVERFLSQAQRYVSAKGGYEPQQDSHAWVFVELFRPSLNAAVERAEEYNRQMQEYRDRILGIGSSTTPPSEEMKDERIVKTVVELDLVGYNSISTHIEQGLDVVSVAALNEQIRSFIHVGLQRANVASEGALVMTTGDGAILTFDSANEAFEFAQGVHEKTQEHNSSRTLPIGKRVFRIGMATGEIVIRNKAEGGFDIAGSTIARAVRLEAKAPPGGVLVDIPTFNSLRADLKTRFGSKQNVQGKRDEQFEAYGAQINADGILDAAGITPSSQSEASEHLNSSRFGLDKRREVLAYLGRLKSSQLPELIFLLEMPIGQRPPDLLSLDQRKSEVLRWVEEENKLTELLDILIEVEERSHS